MDYPSAPHTATGNVSSCTGAVIWVGATALRRNQCCLKWNDKDPPGNLTDTCPTCKYVYQPMTSVCQLPSTAVPVAPSGHTHTMNLSISLAERFLRTAPKFQAPPCPESPKFCVISDLFVDDYMVKRINGKMCYVQRPPPPTPNPTHQPQTAAPQPVPQRSKNSHQVGPTVKQGQAKEKISAPKMDHCSSPSSSEDSGINALGLHYMESCDEDSCVDDDDEEEEDDELSTDGNSSPGSFWDQDECTLLSPSKSIVEIIEKIETTV
nr:UPF0524 protein C3orf70 homolog A isoform X1 [Danio rerio]|eukprot:XP_021336258.1 UPF0524 protein C3orf70 homolog A isoform X1 [Danio rerio]